MPDNDVVLQDAYVSRRHCAILIHLTGERCELHDIASKNGTFPQRSENRRPHPDQPRRRDSHVQPATGVLTRAEAPEVGGQHTQVE